jgi:hypothetical protein
MPRPREVFAVKRQIGAAATPAGSPSRSSLGRELRSLYHDKGRLVIPPDSVTLDGALGAGAGKV